MNRCGVFIRYRAARAICWTFFEKKACSRDILSFYRITSIVWQTIMKWWRRRGEGNGIRQ
jgi:hypothetical protein